MFERVKSVIIKEFKQVLRDPRMRSMLIISPLFQLIVFGYAATTDIRNIATAVYDLDNSKESRELVRAFAYSKYFDVKYYVYDDAQQKDLIDRSKASVVIRINRGFAANLLGDKDTRVQLILDGSDSNTAGAVLSYANRIVQRYSLDHFKNAALVTVQGKEAFSEIDLRSRAWFNENLESRNFYIPGVVALLITLITLLLTAMSIVREKEIGTMEQLIVSPLRAHELILGKLLPFVLIGLFDVTFIILVGVFWFKVPMRGNIFFLFFSTLVYLLTSLGVGLFISTISATQQEAVMAMFLFFFPANLLSGFIFPIENMPRAIQYVTYLNPLRYYLVVLRGIFLKGSGFLILWPQLLMLFLIGTAILTLSALRFRRRLG
jgi:ABC-2 type transport system permease protein